MSKCEVSQMLTMIISTTDSTFEFIDNKLTNVASSVEDTD